MEDPKKRSALLFCFRVVFCKRLDKSSAGHVQIFSVLFGVDAVTRGELTTPMQERFVSTRDSKARTRPSFCCMLLCCIAFDTMSCFFLFLLSCLLPELQDPFGANLCPLETTPKHNTQTLDHRPLCTALRWLKFNDARRFRRE